MWEVAHCKIAFDLVSLIVHKMYAIVIDADNMIYLHMFYHR